MSITEKELTLLQAEALGILETISASQNMELLAAKMKEVTYAFEKDAKLTTVRHLEEMENIIERMKNILIIENRTANL